MTDNIIEEEEEIDLSVSLENYEVDRKYIFKINNEPTEITHKMPLQKKINTNGLQDQQNLIWVYENGKLK